ncbi:MAG: UTP--glucose-1-phosphate uridylyltransferase [Spirochaetes bacterium]|nr:UTP--glucose-1-phosphate uridylyltransferase [Spirochaetota bacterium]
MNTNLRRDMESKGIDIALSEEILDTCNSGVYDHIGPEKALGVPPIDGDSVIDLRAFSGKGVGTFVCQYKGAEERLSELGIDNIEQYGKRRGSGASAKIVFSAGGLDEVGKRLLGYTAYGVLNGGSATSYVDSKKNLALGRDIFDVLKPVFDRIVPLCHDKPKGMTPAYINPDGSPGATFLELKMRARLLLSRQAGWNGRSSPELMPLFQMTSSSNDSILSAFYAETAKGPFLGPLSSSMGLEPAYWRSGIQPLLSAFTHSSQGRPKRFFDRAYGIENASLPLPGGHGQCFRVLASTFEELRGSGKRFAYLGNVDNLGFRPDPKELAILALSGQPAAFEFATRSPVDVKGGILVRTMSGKNTVADIGPAIDFDEVLELEKKGNTILFNCATGLFDLEYLVPRLVELSAALPVRFSDQDKDAGRYSQAEQVTWEITGLLPSFLSFVVEKSERFLAAKLLVETLLTSGFGLEEGSLPPAMVATASGLQTGLYRLLERSYGLALKDGRWIPSDGA